MQQILLVHLSEIYISDVKHLSLALQDIVTYNTHTHTHNAPHAYLILRFLLISSFISATSLESSGRLVISLSSWQCSGAITESVGLFSSNITCVALFIGFKALTTSSALVMSSYFNVHKSASFLQTSGESRAAEIAGCCSRKRSSISRALFHRVTTSNVNLCVFNWSRFCLSRRTRLAVVLRWKNFPMCLTFASSRAMLGSLRPACEARLIMCA